MASGRKSVPDRDYLVLTTRELAGLQEETARLNRRLRNARSAVRSLEERLAALSARIESHLAESDRPLR